MDNIIPLFRRDPLPQEPAIKKERTEAFYEAARSLGEYIKGLPLSGPENDRLIELTIRQVEEAEQGAFNQGFRMGKAFAESRPKG